MNEFINLWPACSTFVFPTAGSVYFWVPKVHQYRGSSSCITAKTWFGTSNTDGKLLVDRLFFFCPGLCPHGHGCDAQWFLYNAVITHSCGLIIISAGVRQIWIPLPSMKATRPSITRSSTNPPKKCLTSSLHSAASFTVMDDH